MVRTILLLTLLAVLGCAGDLTGVDADAHEVDPPFCYGVLVEQTVLVETDEWLPAIDSAGQLVDWYGAGWIPRVDTLVIQAWIQVCE